MKTLTRYVINYKGRDGLSNVNLYNFFECYRWFIEERALGSFRCRVFHKQTDPMIARYGELVYADEIILE